MSAQGWTVPLLAIVSALAVVAAVLAVRVWPRSPDLSPNERAEIAGTPMPPLQKRAWWGLAIGVAALATAVALVAMRGATTYWDDDGFRLTVMGIFLAGLLGSVGVTNLPLMQQRARNELDERDRAVLAQAPNTQATLMLLGLATWLIALAQRFHDEGAVPMVYIYLIFGSIVLLMMIGQSLGIIIGYWFGARRGQG